ncbi:MAG TPA: glycosyltransferase family 4 protein [Bryobacteraceae bacterium]|nr:glycosyltransferase family 4 protein [Bryobacteraceae bacterium]
MPEPNQSRRKRLMYIITRAEHGGAQSHVLDLVRGFRDEFDISVAVGEEGFLTEACRAESIPVHLIPHLEREIKLWSDTRAFFETLKLVRRERPDLVHAHTWKAGFVGRMAARLCRIPSIYTVHMWHFGPELPSTWRIFGPGLERTASRWSERTITVSHSASAVGQQYRIADPSRMIAIHNGIEDSPERFHPGANPIPVVAMVARFTEFKDHETLVRAFATLNTPARLQLIGDGPTRKATERLVAELGIQDRVDFPGDRNDVPRLLCHADVFVLASKLDNLPISILEAMRAGLPVIASDVGGISELVTNGETGLLVPPFSVAPMAGALAELLSDKRKRMRFGRSGRKRYEMLFSLEHMIGRTRAVYAEVLGEARVPGEVVVESADAVLNFLPPR